MGRRPHAQRRRRQLPLRHGRSATIEGPRGGAPPLLRRRDPAPTGAARLRAAALPLPARGRDDDHRSASRPGSCRRRSPPASRSTPPASRDDHRRAGARRRARRGAGSSRCGIERGCVPLAATGKTGSFVSGENAMTQVSTVRGPVDTADLGRTYMHEHVFVLTADVQQNYPRRVGRRGRAGRRRREKLSALAAAGVRTIVDPTVIGLGRYIPRIQRIAEQVPDLNIVVATGCYTYDDVPFFFHYRGPALERGRRRDVPDPMVDMFVGDITDGIAGTGVKAGDAQVRHRPAGPDPRRRAGDARGGQGPPADGRADHRAHPPGHPDRAGGAAGARRGGRRPAAGSCSATAATPPTPTTCSGWPTPGSSSAWTASASTSRSRSRRGPTSSWSCAAAATPSRWCSRQDASCYIDWIDPARHGVHAPVALPAHRRGRAAVPARARRHRRADRHDAGRPTRAATSSRSEATDRDDAGGPACGSLAPRPRRSGLTDLA